jgi:hypothetical protein
MIFGIFDGCFFVVDSCLVNFVFCA